MEETIRLWELETGHCLSVLRASASPINGILGIAWGSDQRLALSGGEDELVRLWDMQTRQCLCVLKGGHEGGVRNVAWSADRRRALSGDWHGGVRV